MSGITIPLGLRHALESGECVLFVGAGIGSHLRRPDGSQAPDASSLAKEMADRFNVPASAPYDLARISQVVELRKGRAELDAFVRQRLADLEPDGTIRWISTIRWRAIFTTNYDLSIERAYTLNPEPPQNPVPVAATADLVRFDPRFEVPVYHLHGTVSGSARTPMVITERDYITFRERRRMLFEVLKQQFATSTILYLGYANRDPNWRLVLDEAAAEFLPSTLPPAYRIVRDPDPLDDEILRFRGVETISASSADFISAAAAELGEQLPDTDRLRRAKAAVPSHLADAFDRAPASTLRLLSSWTYVNQAPFDLAPNVSSFLRGDRANWGLIGRRSHFERDIEGQVFDELLDYATGSTRGPSVIVTLGPAGYGTTTLLMSLGARIVQERAGPVFMHVPGASLREGDIEFAASLFSERPFFIVDNAADYFPALRSAIHRLRETGRPALFLIGERVNEWTQRRDRITGKGFLLEPLSEPEIGRLLDCLTTHGELKTLVGLPRDLQAAAVRQKHGKELLVAMREATEGRGFDAILEDEFRGISGDLAPQLYLAVCCFYQLGTMARDALLASVLGVSLTEMYERTREATEGVVIFEEADESYGQYVARARHRVIADIVWQRCGGAGERERLLAAALGAINLNYRTDRMAFESFIRSDRVVDGIRSFEDKVRFFESACQKDPASPYVRQHYARMLAREKRPELALSQIDEALRIDPRARILHHTRGVILRDLALGTPSIDIARRRLVQSEDAFRQAIKIDARDEYGYQGLSELYLWWADRAPSDDEAAAYVARAEQTINEGLAVVRQRDGLWLVSAQVELWLGNKPEHLAAMAKAVRENPSSIIARYVLGRAYRKDGRPKDALEILAPVIRDHPHEFRSTVEYARALLDLGEPYSKAIPVLRLSTPYGFSDPRFIATLGGMLFMSGEFSEASRVFGEAARQDFPPTERERVQFRPRSEDDPRATRRMRGKVVAVKAGYAFIESGGFPDFFCPGSKFGDLLVRKDLEVTFEPAFTARGPIAEKLRVT